LRTVGAREGRRQIRREGARPLLWINSANDTFFEPTLVNRMVDAYTKAGGQAVHRPVAAFEKDGHNLASRDSGAPISRPLVENFLQGK
jgi:hypothetical protein